MFAGWKWTALAGIVLGAGLVGWNLIGAIKEQEKLKIQLETITRELELEDEVNEALSNAPTDPTLSLEWLHNRNGTN